MGMYKYIKDAWKNPKKTMPELWKQRLMEWRRQNVTVRIEKPTRLDRARKLGYKAIKGVFVVRQRVKKGAHKRKKRKGARVSKTQRRKKVIAKNYQRIAEERADKKYPNCEVLNSYWVAEDGKNKWYEIIMVDPESPEVKSKNYLKWMSSGKHRNRVQRGLTSAGKKSRGLRHKGKGAEKVRPSHRAKGRKAN